MERHGISMIGAHDILPDHIATYGIIAGTKPAKALEPTIRIGVEGAELIGNHDIGQAVVAMGRRIIAVEGLEGTDQMLGRVATLRAENRIDAKSQLVLIKIAKPRQELRADMPTIGPGTIEGCTSAGIGTVCVSAGSTLIMDVKQTIKNAKTSGISLIGIDPKEWA
jgi:UDP-2,3-diacylglucosamine hydrolase